MEERFDYTAAVKELEELAARVEDPSTGLDDIDKSIKRAEELAARCRAYLREARDRVGGIE